jgi:4-hydroxythreonine-4-phosphate dehydrogenase
MTNLEPPRIAITMGDPAGVGPEVALKALSDPAITQAARCLIVGDARVLQRTAQHIGLRMPDTVVTDIESLPSETHAAILDLQRIAPSQFQPGQLSALCGLAAIEYIRAATLLCLHGQADAMATAPVNKEAIALNGIPFTGHTEYIAQLCGVTESRMLLVNDRLRVVHVTTHCSLRDACAVDRDRVLETILAGHAAAIAMGFPDPRIAVCGLNPHAGEHGLFGQEDETAILPAVQEAKKEGIRCDGPLPADTLFYRAVRGDYDLVVAMYHDQGHIPMKLIDFERTVNVSLGLPIIRTSVDHGTAFDIVGRNQADPSSLKAAIRLAATMARNTRCA